MKKFLAILLVITAVACKKQIALKPIVALNSYLVVDGSINVGDSSIIALSHTVNIAGKARSNPEVNATVTIESSGGSSYPLVSKNNGNYVSAALNLSVTQNYRLKIVTGDGKQYASDFVPVKNSPAIDSLGYAVKTEGLQINVNTHDAANNTHYYRWDYVDTYQVRSQYESKLIVVNGDTSAFRTAEQQIYNCWLNDTSGTINLGSSAKLAKDVISNQAIALILPTSEKLRIGISILVKQHALTSDAFNYFDLLQKNSDQVGGVFDAQPSELTGNIHCLTNPAEPVIGYITAGAVAKARLFVDNENLPGTWLPDLSYYDGCSLITELYDYVPPMSGIVEHQVREYVYTGIETPVDTVLNPKLGVISARPRCVDCTLRGTSKKPSFWK
ncbi:DUF4249 domain-containing protein [Mucilaginibacter sp. FT3.2]|uniref:DUF4249 domain-containing protein n=1 Tax=Mucilaginibacter sp. FT3.2 TaxID=2723090 RepID=UPI001612A315|nr:DUF4249 domain-containing protein [Mucilaginibacter sp. FT3.2]MBB6231552.1 hypothetical protein [Mucilaginibacter sp. FT3.2]